MIAWWNSKTIANTTRLWKPGLQPIQNNTLNTNSWYKSSIQKHIELTDDIISHELKEPIEHTITRKIKINPNLEQRKLLTEWWHAYRYTYNKTVEDIATNALSSTVRLFIKPETQIINPDKLLKFELGSRFELPSKWSVKFKIIDPKLKVTLKYTEKSGVKLKIKIVQDDYIKVNFDFTYPKIDHWHSYRDKYVTAPTLPFLKSVDKRIRASAVKDACANYKTICSLAKNHNKHGTIASLPFKHKKYGDSWTIGMEKSCITPVLIERLYKGRKKKKRKKPNIINGFNICISKMKEPIKCYEKIPETFGDPKLHKDKYGEWYLLVPIDIKPTIEAEVKPIIALDPGISTFVTGYSTNGTIHNHVQNNVDTLKELKNISYLQSCIDKKKNHIKNKTQKIAKLRKKAINKIDDMHWKVINSLLKEHSKIIIGKFNVKSILQSSTITKPAKRKLKALSHYGFKTKLIYKAASLGREVKTWSEWGTTKGCPCCGHKIKITLSERIFRCNHCNYEAGRDDKAACCIMLKYLSGVW